MAFYSYRFGPALAGTKAIIVATEGGTPLRSLAAWKDEKTGVTGNLGEARKYFERSFSHIINSHGLVPQDSDQTDMSAILFGDGGPMHVAPVREMARGLAEQNCFLVTAPGTVDDSVMESALREKLAEYGHTLSSGPTAGVLHVEKRPEGLCLSSNAAHWPLLMVQLSAVWGPQMNEGKIQLVSDPTTGRVFMSPMAELNVPAVIEKLEARFTQLPSSRKPLAIVDHTPLELLKMTQPAVAVGHPMLRTGRQGTEVSFLGGNVHRQESLLKSQAHFLDGGYLLSGDRAEIISALKNLDVQSASGFTIPSRRLVKDVPEKEPQPVIASVAAMFNKHRLSSVATLPPGQIEATAAAARAVMKREVQLLPLQVEGVSFLSNQHKAAILADDTGGGKTIQAAVAMSLVTPPNRKTLVVCPPKLIPQYLRSVDRFIANLADNPTAGTPPWLERIQPAQEREALQEIWNRVSSRFVFLPETALHSGVSVDKGKLKTAAKAPNDTGFAFQHSARLAIETVMAEPISSMIVDEAQGFRNGGSKFQLLQAMVGGALKKCQANIDYTILSTATPMHKSGPSLFPILKLGGLAAVQKMDMVQFCEEYCSLRHVESDGLLHPISGKGSGAYGMIKESKIPEVTKFLKEKMLSRPLETIAPERTIAREVNFPIPYEPSPSLGVSIKGAKQSGELVQIAPLEDGRPIHLQLAKAKVPSTVHKVRELAAQLPEGEKVVIFTDFVESSKMLQSELNAAGLPTYKLDGTSCVDSHGRDLGNRNSFLKSLGEDPACKAIVITTGAGGTGLDGLHYLSRTGVFNDFFPLGGRITQAIGRLHRVYNEPPPDPLRAARIFVQVANNEHDIRNCEELIDRLHEQTFIREQGLLKMLDSDEMVASLEMELQSERFKMHSLIGSTAMLRTGRNIEGGVIDGEDIPGVDNSVDERPDPLLTLIEPRGASDNQRIAVQAIEIAQQSMPQQNIGLG